MSRKYMERLSLASVASALVLLSSAALGSESQEATSGPEEMTVKLPRNWIAFATPGDELDTSHLYEALVKALDRDIAVDLARELEAMDASRVDLAIAAVPTRG